MRPVRTFCYKPGCATSFFACMCAPYMNVFCCFLNDAIFYFPACWLHLSLWGGCLLLVFLCV